MTWKKLLADRRVVAEPSGREDIANLRELARRNLKDAAVEALSEDGRFDCAYGAARAIATIVVRAEGYRVRQPGAHYNTFLALEAADPSNFADFATFFDACRIIRNEVSYDTAGVVSESQIAELIERVILFQGLVEKWLARQHPDLV